MKNIHGSFGIVIYFHVPYRKIKRKKVNFGVGLKPIK